jgi:hypothetical protein
VVESSDVNGVPGYERLIGAIGLAAHRIGLCAENGCGSRLVKIHRFNLGVKNPLLVGAGRVLSCKPLREAGAAKVKLAVRSSDAQARARPAEAL